MPSATRGFRGSIEFALAALAVSAIAERTKAEGWAAEYASPAAHVVSGWFEALGPERPDEVVVWEGSHVALTVLASRRKPWATDQVIEFRGQVFRLQGVTMGRQGGNGAIRYDFGRLEAREVIRGTLLSYPEAGAPVPGAEPNVRAHRVPDRGDDPGGSPARGTR